MRKSPPRQQECLPRGLKRRSTKRKTVVNITNTKYPIVSQICRELGYQSISQRDGRWDIYWSDNSIPIQFIAKMHPQQRVNHFSAMSQLSRKGLLAKNIKRMQKAFPQSYNFMPLTFLLPRDIFILNKYQERTRFRGQRPTFIIKPQVGCQGKGIYLWQNNIELQARKEIVQVYLERPLLYKGLKFDLRVYVLMTSCYPLQLYIFNQGLVRFATEMYQRPNSHNIQQLRMHLTNYAINRDSLKYVYNESLNDLSRGHKKSLAQFFQTMKVMGLPSEEYWSIIKDTAVKTFIAGLPWFQKQYEVAQPTKQSNNMCFQLLGLDFIIEQNHRIYLLQVNHTPSFTTDTPLDHHLKSNLIKDTLELVTQQQKTKRKIERSRMNTVGIGQRQVSTSEVTFSRAKQKYAFDEEEQYDREVQEKGFGSFEKIFPIKNQKRQVKYNSLITYSLGSMAFESTPPKKHKTAIVGSLVKKRMKSEPRTLAPLGQFSYPPKEQTKQRLKVSRIIRPEPVREVESRKAYNAFDRQKFRQYIKSRRDQYDSNRRGNETEQDDYDGIRGEQVQNSAQLLDIISYHKHGGSLAQSRDEAYDSDPYCRYV